MGDLRLRGHRGAAPLLSSQGAAEKAEAAQTGSHKACMGGGVWGGGRCHGFCVPNTGMGQGGGTRQKLPLRSGQEALSGIRGTAGGAEVGSLERGRFTGTDRCKGFLKEAAVEV